MMTTKAEWKAKFQKVAGTKIHKTETRKMQMYQKQKQRLEDRLKRLGDNDRILVKLNKSSSKYDGSIMECQRDRWWWHSDFFYLYAPELPKRLNVHYRYIEFTREKEIRLTNSPTYTSTIEVKDFSGRIIKKGDILFGEGKLIRVENFLPSGACQIVCVRAITRSQEGKIQVMRNLKKYVYLEDPTMLILKT